MSRGVKKYMSIQIIKNQITKKQLQKIADEQFGDVVKAVVDVMQDIMAVGGELHVDEELVLMEQEGSAREHTWGINIYPGNTGDDFIEFDSMVNLKPSFGNRSRSVDDRIIREKIKEIVGRLVV